MTWIVVACCVGTAAGFLGGCWKGWCMGIKDTERRWAAAVARVEDARRRRG